MNLARIATRSSLALALLALAACQTPSVQQDTAAAPTGTAAVTPQPGVQAPDASMQAGAEQGAPVAVFLADMVRQDGWREVPIGSDAMLYLDPQPIVTRDDLTGVQAGANRDGQGLLALVLSEDAKLRLQDITTRNPNKRLALVVGRTLLAAPGYNEPVATGQLMFPVGSEENAAAAARAIAGVDNGGAPPSGSAPAAPPAGQLPQ